MRFLRSLCIGLFLIAPVSGSASDDGPGAALFLRGEGASALLAQGQVRVDAAEFTCAQCHGGDAKGRGEGGTDFPSITWSSLSDPARAGGAYNESSFMRAVRDGIAADGRILNEAMPRYEVDSSVLTALADFLVNIDERERRGIFPAGIGIGFPQEPVRYQLFDLALSEANAAGGVWGRRFSLASKGTELIDWIETESILADALTRAEQSAVTNYLQSQSINAVFLDIDAEYWRAGLSRIGMHLTDDAPVRITLDDNGILTILPNQQETIRFPFSLPSAVSLNNVSVEDLTQEMRSAYAVGATIAKAIMDCGRAVTRACVRERLGNAELTDWVETVRSGSL